MHKYTVQKYIYEEQSGLSELVQLTLLPCVLEVGIARRNGRTQVRCCSYHHTGPRIHLLVVCQLLPTERYSIYIITIFFCFADEIKICVGTASLIF